MIDFDIYDIEEKIGYKFKNSTLLKQAFTTPSITKATQHKIQNYQVLEFIGDSVLSLAVVKDLAHEFCCIDNDGQMVCKTDEGHLTVRKQEMIKNETLAHCSKLLGLNQYVNKSYDHPSVDIKNKKGDLIEAILGAVAFDSNWDINILCSVMKNIEKYKDVEVNYIERLEHLCKKKRFGDPLYRFEQENGVYKCYVSIPDTDCVFGGKAESELASKNKACKQACAQLKTHRKLKASNENMNAISRLNVMYMAKEIGQPIYNFEKITESGNTKIKCQVTIENIEYEFCSKEDSKKAAKLNAAEALLNYILGEEDNIIKDDENVVRGRGLLKLIMSKYYPLEKIGA